MKNTVQKTNKNRSSRLVAFAAIIGLGLGAIFTSAASAVMDTDPVIEVEGFCHLLGPDSSSGVWMSITNDDSWEEDYVIGIFEGLYEDGDMPADVVEITLEAGETEAGPLVVDSPIATIQVLDLTGAMEDALVYDEVHIVCMPDIPDFGDEDDEDSDDGPDFDFDFEIDIAPEIADIDLGAGPDLPGFDFGDEDDDSEVTDETEEAEVTDEAEEAEIAEVTDEAEVAEVTDEAEVAEVTDETEEGLDHLGPVCGMFGCSGVDEAEAAAQAQEEAEAAAQAIQEANETSTTGSEGIGVPPEPKINPEDTDDKKDSEELASSEGTDSQGKSGLSILWIILIIVGGITTVGTTTRAIQKNNN